MRSVLFVDDEEEDLQALAFQLDDRYRVIPCRDGPLASALVKKEHPDAVVLDLEMPGYDGYRVLGDLKDLPAPPPVLMLSGHSEPLYVVRALREGARDFVAKPYNLSMLRWRLDRMMAGAEDRPRKDGPCGQSLDSAMSLRGSSPVMCKVREEIAAYAPCPLPVLIRGESGTGKDIVARELHRRSLRAAGPFVVRNLAAFPESLVKSELFGCERGAYTDAQARSGCFEEANGGTLFLDEVGDTDVAVQVALLRVVEDGYLARLGSSVARHVDCRLICATNRNLEELIAQGRFRLDFKYRIEGFSIRLPALREHPEDIPELVELYCGPEQEISATALDLLSQYEWPGNVRQLKACMDRAKLLSRGERIQEKHLIL